MAKRCKISSNTREETQPDDGVSGEDYISKIPEIALSHILSRLPTKEAVRTCVLAKDWEYKWTNVDYICLDDDAQTGNTTVFVDFMERISRLSLSHYMRRFYLRFSEEYDLTRMTTWISPVLGPNLRDFTLMQTGKGLVIPQSLLKCTLLRNLSLWLECTFRIPAMYSFPNLKRLSLYKVEIVNENSNTNTMILKFPVLKTLHVLYSKWLNMEFVEIHAPRLDTLVSHTEVKGAVHDYSIKIPGAKLANFEVWGGLHDRFILTGTEVVSATLHCLCELHGLKKFNLQVQRLFSELSSMRNLNLSSLIPKGFEHSIIGLPRYNKLKRMTLFGCGNLNTLLQLFHAATHLESIEISVGGWGRFEYDVLENAPNCLANSLEKVSFYYSAMYMLESQFRLESFILKFGAQLKTVCYVVEDASHKNEIHARLSVLPAASASLQIVAG